MIKRTGVALPELAIDVAAALGLTVKGTMAFEGDRLKIGFDDLPDIPISTMRLTIPGGAGSPLIASRDLCVTPPASLNVQFRGQGDQLHAATTTPTIDGCSPRNAARSGLRLKARLRGTPRRPRLSLTAGATRPLRTLRIRFPRRLRLERSAARLAKRTVRSDGQRDRKARLRRVNARTLRVNRLSGNPRRLTLRLPANALAAKRLRRSTNLTFRARATTRAGAKLRAIERTRMPKRARPGKGNR
jgi:hypothetical protein